MGFIWRGYNNNEIIHGLKEDCNITLSEKTLRRRMNDTWGIYRRSPEVDIQKVEDIIKEEIDEDLKGNVGYRRMTNILRLKYHLTVKRNMVLDLMNKVDPDGVALRKSGKIKRRIAYSAGPDEIWSFDGHDKCICFVPYVVHPMGYTFLDALTLPAVTSYG